MTQRSLDEWMCRRILAGWTPQAVAAAGRVSVRTVYRWRRELMAVEEVRVGGHVASFAVYKSREPILLGPWTRVSTRV